MTEADIQTFSRTGILALRGFLPKKTAQDARDHIESELKRLKIKDGGKINSSKFKGLPIFQATGQLSQMIKQSPTIERLFTEELLSAMSFLAQGKLKPAHPYPQHLISLPHKDPWDLKQLNWHLDLKVPKLDFVPGVQAFVLIDDLKPQGGATMALAGSHKLHYLTAEHNAHSVLRSSAEFMTEPEKFLNPQTLQGTQVQIVEMTGRAGDVYLMDLRTLHAPSINSGKSIRMMATNRFIK